MIYEHSLSDGVRIFNIVSNSKDANATTSERILPQTKKAAVTVKTSNVIVIEFISVCFILCEDTKKKANVKFVWFVFENM